MSNLFNLIYQGHINALILHIEKNPQAVNQLEPGNRNGWHALHVAASLERVDIITLLVERGANPNQPDNDGWTPLHIAVMKGSLNCIITLLKFGSDINALTSSGKNAVYIAVQFHRPIILKYLINSNANTSTKNNFEFTSLKLAVTSGNLSCTKLLISKEKDINSKDKYGNSLLFYALSSNQLAIAEWLLISKGISETEIFIDKFDAKLLDAAPNTINFIRFYRALKLADTNNITDSLVTCLSSDSLNSPLLATIIRVLRFFKQIDKFQDLLQDAVQKLIPTFNEDLLLYIRSLLNANLNFTLAILNNLFADIDIYNLDGKGRNILNLAVEIDHVDCVKEIVAHYGNRILIKTDDAGNGPLHYCALYAAYDCLDYFIKEKKLTIDSNNHLGQTPLHLAAINGHEELVSRMCFDYHANYLQRDKDLDSPVESAVKHSQLPVIQIMIEMGYPIDEDLLELAKKKSNNIVFSYLSSKQSEPILRNYSEIITQAVQPGRILVFKGGGVKGIAYCGAIKKLVKNKFLDLSKTEIVAGTSAGAITALLLAVGYSVEDSENIIASINFEELLDEYLRARVLAIKEAYDREGISGILTPEIYKWLMKIKSGNVNEADVVNLIKQGISSKLFGIYNFICKELGIHDDELAKLTEAIKQLKEKYEDIIQQVKSKKGIFAGEALRQEFIRRIKEAGLGADITFEELHELAKTNPKYKDLYVFAFNANTQQLDVFSHEHTPETIIADAVRCSMSIQIFFQPHYKYIKLRGQRVRDTLGHMYYDGGSTNNLFLSFFDKQMYCGGLNKKSTLKQTNLDAIAFQLVTPAKYQQLEYDSELLEAKIDNLEAFILSVIRSILSFTKQDSDQKLNPDEEMRMLNISTLGVGTVDFNLDKNTINRLIKSGKEGATRFCIRYEALPDYQHRHFSFLQKYLSGGSLPKDTQQILEIIYKLIKQEDAIIAKNTLYFLSLPLLFRDTEGNCLYHLAAQKGDRDFLERLYHLEVDIYKTPVNLMQYNNNEETPIDSILKCRDQDLREEVINFFVEKSTLTAKLYADKANIEDKKEYVLMQAFLQDIETKKAEENKQHFLEELNLLEAIAESNKGLPEGKFASGKVVFWIYNLFSDDKEELITKLKLNINQLDAYNQNAVHYAVAFNDVPALERLCKRGMELDVLDSSNHTSLDLILSVKSYSKQATSIARQLLAFTLVKFGAKACQPTNKNDLADLLINFKDKHKHIQEFIVSAQKGSSLGRSKKSGKNNQIETSTSNNKFRDSLFSHPSSSGSLDSMPQEKPILRK